MKDGHVMNLLAETLEVLNKHERSSSDVLCVIDRNDNGIFKSTWRDFEEQAASINYRNWWGSNDISVCLTIVGTDFWMIRREYDGRSWWEFLAFPKAPEATHKLDLLHPSYTTLAVFP